MIFFVRDQFWGVHESAANRRFVSRADSYLCRVRAAAESCASEPGLMGRAKRRRIRVSVRTNGRSLWRSMVLRRYSGSRDVLWVEQPPGEPQRQIQLVSELGAADSYSIFNVVDDGTEGRAKAMLLRAGMPAAALEGKEAWGANLFLSDVLRRLHNIDRASLPDTVLRDLAEAKGKSVHSPWLDVREAVEYSAGLPEPVQILMLGKTLDDSDGTASVWTPGYARISCATVGIVVLQRSERSHRSATSQTLYSRTESAFAIKRGGPSAERDELGAHCRSWRGGCRGVLGILATVIPVFSPLPSQNCSAKTRVGGRGRLLDRPAGRGSISLQPR